MLGKDPEEDSFNAESEGSALDVGKKHLHCKILEEEEGQFYVCQRVKDDKPGEARRGIYTLCSLWTSSCRRCGSSEGLEQGDACIGLPFCCINLAAVNYAFEGNKT